MLGKFRASFSERGSEYFGKVDATGQYSFIKECLLTTVDAVAKSFGMTSRDLLIDLYRTEEKLNADTTSEGGPVSGR